jgi:hypothetical protein
MLEFFGLVLAIVIGTLLKDLILAYVVAFQTMHHRKKAMAKLMAFEERMPKDLPDLLKNLEDEDEPEFETDEALRNAT